MCEDTRYLYGISVWVYNYYQKSQQAGQITQIDRKARARRFRFRLHQLPASLGGVRHGCCSEGPPN